MAISNVKVVIKVVRYICMSSTKKIKLNCQQCSQEFEVHYYRLNSAKFCSKKCLDQSKIGKKHSLEHRLKISNSHKGKPHPIFKKREFTSPIFPCKDCGKTVKRIGTNQIRCKSCVPLYKKNLLKEWAIKHPKGNPKIPVVCQWCKKEFKTTNTRIKQKIKYCSMECRNKSYIGNNLKRIEKICKYCRNKFEVQFSSPQIFCSKKCMNRGQDRSKTSGEGHWNWQGGKTPLKILIRESYIYKEWRESIFKRDNYTCQICKGRGGRLHVDHWPKQFADIIRENNIQSLEDAINCEVLWDKENNRALCEDCHKKTDSYLNGLKYIFKMKGEYCV